MTYETKIRRYYASIGKCPYCHGRNKLFGDEKMCPECRAKSWEYSNYYKQNHPEFAEKTRQSARDKRISRAENNLCITCGQPLTDTRYKSCEKCRFKNMLRMRRKRMYQSTPCITNHG